MKAILKFVLVGLSSIGFSHEWIHDHGYWQGEEVVCEHRFDSSLARAIATFFQQEGAQNVVDFGCGTGEYIKEIRGYGIYCIGYDGNPETYKISGGVAEVADLSEPLNLGRQFDWVLSLEVGEHLPRQYERIFIENLHRHNKKGIILSWAKKGQGGFGHFNEQDNDYIKAVMKKYGYENDLNAEQHLRNQSSLGWFRNTIMVFRKSVKYPKS